MKKEAVIISTNVGGSSVPAHQHQEDLLSHPNISVIVGMSAPIQLLASFLQAVEDADQPRRRAFVYDAGLKGY